MKLLNKSCFIIMMAVGMMAVSNCTTGEPEEESGTTDPGLNSCETQDEIDAYMLKWACEYEDSVVKAYENFCVEKPHLADTHELALWNEYEATAMEAYKRINMDGFCGSAAPMGWAEYRYDIVDQLRIAFADAKNRHDTFENELVRREYDRFIYDCLPPMQREQYKDPEDYTLAEKQESLQKEKDAWEKWMAYREQISAMLNGREKSAFEQRTNEIRREKLIQLKNQYDEYGITIGDLMTLDHGCSDRELRRYSCLYQIRAEYYKENFPERD